MINKINLKNFKCFHSQEFEFSNLTIFCGSNSIGKSTAIQSILSIKQNIDNIPNGFINTYGKLFNFGQVKDMFCHTPNDENFEITINDKCISAKVSKSTRDDYVLKLNSSSVQDINCLRGDFVYLCAERFGPRASFDINRHSESLDIGIYGQYALSEYMSIAEFPAPNEKFASLVCAHLLGDLEKTSVKPVIFTKAVVREAMRKVCPTFDMNVIQSNEIDKIYNTFPSINGRDSIRPMNVGFGVSYILPIIIAAAAMKPGGILIVENPEVHLHPQAQSNLIGLLTSLSECGIQVIIETHSDHIVNGLRVYSKEKEIPAGHSTIYSITDEGQKRAVKNINVDSDGNLSDVDDGFFDQISKDLLRLF